VSNPNNGFSSHSRGNTVDVTLAYPDGTELSMPTGFDDFSKLADRDYSDCDQEAAANAMLLEKVMQDCGFKPYSGEWWHFTDTRSYPVEHTFQPVE
jgi:D-alanyl-D-alanine dipeptidase